MNKSFSTCSAKFVHAFPSLDLFTIFWWLLEITNKSSLHHILISRDERIKACFNHQKVKPENHENSAQH
jgi:hypothetical protein